MKRTAESTRLTPRQRLTRGLTYSTVGPVDVTRGIVGLGVHGARAGAAGVRRRYRESRLDPEVLAAEFAAAQEVVAGLPQARRGHRRWVIAGLAAGILAAGAVAFSIVRRTTHASEPSSLPPSVDIHPQP